MIPDEKNIVIEHTLRYSGIDEIKDVIAEYGVDNCKNVWIHSLLQDNRLVKLNYFLAKFIFNISDEDKTIEEFIKSNTQSRYDRIRKIFN